MDEHVLAAVTAWLQVLVGQSSLNLFRIVRDLRYIEGLHKDNPEMERAYRALARIVDIVSKVEESK